MTRRFWLTGAIGGTAGVFGIWAPGALGQGRLANAPVCAGQPISRIDVVTKPPFEPGGANIVARAARAATELHATTRASVVRRYLTFQLGDRCAPLQLRESERILRAQPFLADAEIVEAPDGADGVAVTVVTVDEVSLVLDGSASTRSPVVRALRLGEQNLAGSAIAALVQWQHGVFYRDIFRGRFVDYQFLGRPYQLSVEGTRNELGGGWTALASHPFLTDLQRTSWRASAGEVSGYLYFLRPNAPELAMPVSRSYGDIGGVAAIGAVRRQQLLLGGTISRERERTGRVPAFITDSGVFGDTSSILVGRYGEHRSTRLNLLVGFRDLRFVRVTGFDAVEGAQDVRDGYQLAALLGRGFRVTDRDDRDYFLSTDLYAGRATPGSFTGIEVLTERRRDLDTRQWDGILASGRGAWYAHPAPKYTTLVSAEYSGGWRQRVPFQLTFADREGGLRGYGASELSGAQRLVTRIEERYRLGHVRQFAGVAVGVFSDLGKLWAGDAPFGVTTGVKASAGVSLFAALPPRSRRTWRMDVAVPINDREGRRRYEVRFSNHDFTRWFWREPGDVQTSRERAVPTSIYNWP